MNPQRTPDPSASGRTARASRLPRPAIGPVTRRLLVANLVFFTFTAVQARNVTDVRSSSLFQTWALLPDDLGPLRPGTFLSAGFVHLSLLHLAVNMLALAWLGATVESVLGWRRFLALYTLALLGSSTAVYFLSPVPVVGASGAVLGVMAAAAALAFRLRQQRADMLRMLLVNIAISFLPGISLWAHLGGLLTGAIVTLTVHRSALRLPTPTPARAERPRPQPGR
ncbi:rhomboid family intramembrane serine protease [Nocardia sp. IFM 10818]